VGENGFARFVEDTSSNVQFVARNFQKFLTSTYPCSGRCTSRKDLHKIGVVRVQAFFDFFNRFAISCRHSVFTTIPHILQNVQRIKKENKSWVSHNM